MSTTTQTKELREASLDQNSSSDGQFGILVTPDEADSEYDVYHWTDDRGFTFVADTDDVAHVHKLTAYVEHGKRIFEDDVTIHHSLYANLSEQPSIKIDVPEFLIPLEWGDHISTHQDGEWTANDGILQLLPDSSGDGDGDEQPERRGTGSPSP